MCGVASRRSWPSCTTCSPVAYKTETTFQRLDDIEHELAIHEFTVSVNLNKNKRPSGRLVDEVLYEMDVETGVSCHFNGNLPAQYRERPADGGLRVVEDWS